MARVRRGTPGARSRPRDPAGRSPAGEPRPRTEGMCGGRRRGGSRRRGRDRVERAVEILESARRVDAPPEPDDLDIGVTPLDERDDVGDFVRRHAEVAHAPGCGTQGGQLKVTMVTEHRQLISFWNAAPQNTNHDTPNRFSDRAG